MRSKRPPSALLARMRSTTAALLDQDRAARCARAAETNAFVGRRVAVTGAVRRPVVFMWDEGVTVRDALAIAHGLRPSARRVLVLRRTEHGVAQIELDLVTSEGVTDLMAGDEVRVLE